MKQIDKFIALPLEKFDYTNWPKTVNLTGDTYMINLNPEVDYIIRCVQQADVISMYTYSDRSKISGIHKVYSKILNLLPTYKDVIAIIGKGNKQRLVLDTKENTCLFLAETDKWFNLNYLYSHLVSLKESPYVFLLLNNTKNNFAYFINITEEPPRDLLVIAGKYLFNNSVKFGNAIYSYKIPQLIYLLYTGHKLGFSYGLDDIKAEMSYPSFNGLYFV